jgi:hypothetical protein
MRPSENILVQPTLRRTSASPAIVASIVATTIAAPPISPTLAATTLAPRAASACVATARVTTACASTAVARIGGETIDAPIAISIWAQCCAASKIKVCAGVISRRGAVAILKCEEGGLDSVLLGDDIAYTGCRNEIYAPEQRPYDQADDYKNDSQFDERKSCRPSSHA